jgi:hypothetical protein
MKPVLLAMAALLMTAGQAIAKDDAGQWVTFKTGHDSYGPIEHQIDRTSIRRAGPYFTFQTRIWARQMKQPITININEALFYWSQTFAVDCAHHKFGAQFIDSNLPAEARHKATLETMHWEDLDKVPAVGPAVCSR